MGCTQEGSGTPKAVTETEERIAKPRGRMKCSHLLNGACRREPRCSRWVAPPEAGGFVSGFPGCHKPGPKKEGGARSPGHIPGPPSAGLSDLSALHVSLGVKSPALNVQKDPTGQYLLIKHLPGAGH